MFKHVVYFQIAFTLGCTHFAFANAGRGADQDSFSHDADRQEIRQMDLESPSETPAKAEDSDNGTPSVKTDNGVQMISRAGPRIPCPIELGVCGRV
jgi:hypothetical protein